MWNLIEHDSTEICHCNGDELVFQVHQQLSKRHSTLTSLHWADTTVANVPPPQSSSHSVGLVLDSMQICIPSKSFMLVFKLIFSSSGVEICWGCLFRSSLLYFYLNLCVSAPLFYSCTSVFPFFAFRLAVIIFAQFFEQHLHESFCSTANPLFKVFCHIK